MSDDGAPNDELARREERAHAMGGPEKLARRKQAGLLNARERIDALVDADSFLETGLLAVSSVNPADREKTPADGKVAGFGRIDGRTIGVVSNDFTVKGASSSLTNMKKIARVTRTAAERGFPMVFLGESSGARMPDNMGARGMGSLLGNDPSQYARIRTSPWASAVLGPCYGSSAWYACLSDFVVMRRGAVLAVASPPLASLAIGQKVEAEELGGHELHSKTTGLTDRIVDDDQQALDEVRRFLSYMPSHCDEPPPRAAVPEGSDEAAREVAALVPENRRTGYDVRKVVEAVLDRGSFFELKPRFGRPAVTGLGRLGGDVVGVVANNPMMKAGALDVAACEKITQLLVTCDSFNIPLVFLVDTPGFVIGVEGERIKAPGKIMNFMTALQMCSVPKISVIMRKSYGQAYLNMGGGRNSDSVLAWPSAEVSFMEPYFAARVVTWGQDVDEAELARIEAEMKRDSGVWDLAEIFAVDAVVRPEETRSHLIETLAVHQQRRGGRIGRHRLANWPTTF